MKLRKQNLFSLFFLGQPVYYVCTLDSMHWILCKISSIHIVLLYTSIYAFCYVWYILSIVETHWRQTDQQNNRPTERRTLSHRAAIRAKNLMLSSNFKTDLLPTKFTLQVWLSLVANKLRNKLSRLHILLSWDTMRLHT